MSKEIDQKERKYAVYVGEKPSKERCRQQGGVVPEIIDRDYHDRIQVRRYKARYECVLDAYLKAKVITKAEHRAGIIFRRAYHNAVILRRKAYNHIGIRAMPDKPSHSDLVLREAYRTLSPHNKGAIIDICGFGHIIYDKAKIDCFKKGLEQLVLCWKDTADEILLRR